MGLCPTKVIIIYKTRPLQFVLADKRKPQINTDTLTSYGVECLLRLKGVQVTQIFR